MSKRPVSWPTSHTTVRTVRYTAVQSHKRRDSQQDFKISCCESLVCYCVRENTASGNCPIPLLSVSIPVCLPLGPFQFHQVLFSRPWILPLFPDAAPESAAQPAPDWASLYVGNLPSLMALYAISIRQNRVSPPSFFRFRLATDTLDLSYILPTAGRIRVFHPLERALTGRTSSRHLPTRQVPVLPSADTHRR